MSRWQANFGWGLLAAMMAGGFWLAWSPGEAQVANPVKKSPAPETLLPANSVVYLGYDGLKAHRADFEKTAIYKAVYETGLKDDIIKLVTVIYQQTGQDEEQFTLFKEVYETLTEHGVSLAVAVSAEQGPPQAYSVVVFHEGAKFQPQLAQFVNQASQGDIDFQSKTISGRKVTRGILPKSPGIEMGWWNEGRHLVVVLGINAVENAVAVAAGDAPNIKQHPLWKKYHDTKPPAGMTTLSWLDLGTLRKTFGELPLPSVDPDVPRPKANDVVAALGLEHTGAVVSRSGFQGEACWSETLLENTGPRTGLLALVSDKSITLKDLPPLPADNLGFHVHTMDWSKVYANVVETATKLAKLGPPAAQAQLDGLLQNLPAILGLDPQDDLFKTLGDVSCFYADGEMNLFGTGLVVAQQVKDEKTFTNTLMKLVNRAAQQTGPRELRLTKTKKQGRDIITLEIGMGMFNPSFTVADGWFVLGLVPQSVEAFYLRLDGKLDRWKPRGQTRKSIRPIAQEVYFADRNRPASRDAADVGSGSQSYCRHASSNAVFAPRRARASAVAVLGGGTSPGGTGGQAVVPQRKSANRG